MIKSKLLLVLFVPIFLLLVTVQTALAHVVVKPASVSIASFQTFTVGVPVEGESPTVEVKLMIPSSLKHVTPNVKPGWEIEVMKTGEGEDAMVTEIVWSGGEIPVGQRDDFMFSAQVPEMEAKLDWKAYQTSADGTTVAWDGEPGGEFDFAVKGPYSVTKVINDLEPEDTQTAASFFQMGGTDMLPVIALAVSVLALVINFTHHGKARKK